jgi:hypothetical protein
MKKTLFFSNFKFFSILIAIVINFSASAQQNNSVQNTKSAFWQKVRFGGGLGLGISNGYTNISVSPSAIYNVNQYVSLGVGAQYSYASQKNSFTSNIYGGSLIALFNPIEGIQLSADLEQLRVNRTYSNASLSSNGFWNTALFLGAGYVTNNVTLGVRYNVLYKESDGVYGQAFMPFVRFYF